MLYRFDSCYFTLKDRYFASQNETTSITTNHSMRGDEGTQPILYDGDIILSQSLYSRVYYWCELDLCFYEGRHKKQ